MSTSDRFKEKTTRFIRDLAQNSEPIRKMYFFDPKHEDIPSDTARDLFFEKALTKTKGIVHKYPGRVLFLVSYTCAANCRYCERQDRVGVGLDAEGRVGSDDIADAVTYIQEHPDIYEVIFSGGDPLTHPQGLRQAAQALSEVDHVKVLRIHTRFPTQMPEKVNLEFLRALCRLGKTFYLSLHIDHPDELTEETELIIKSLRKMGFILLCQTVFLKGVNDAVEVLEALFLRLFQLGVRPYYIYHCQPIPTTMHFVMSIADEVRIMTALREKISGLAFPQHVVELQHTTGKLIAPTNHWHVDWSTVTDFLGNTHNLVQRTMRIQEKVTGPKRAGLS